MISKVHFTSNILWILDKEHEEEMAHYLRSPWRRFSCGKIEVCGVGGAMTPCHHCTSLGASFNEGTTEENT